MAALRRRYGGPGGDRVRGRAPKAWTPTRKPRLDAPRERRCWLPLGALAAGGLPVPQHAQHRRGPVPGHADPACSSCSGRPIWPCTRPRRWPAAPCVSTTQMRAVVTARAALSGGRPARPPWRTTSFVLHFQPQVDHTSRYIGRGGTGALAAPERGLVSPLDFIARSPETGLILTLGRWVLHSALRCWRNGRKTRICAT